jgi:hypothetical protein
MITHIYDTGIFNTVGPCCIEIHAQIVGIVAAGIDARTVFSLSCLSLTKVVKSDKDWVRVDISGEPVKGASRFDMGSFRGPAALNVAI